MKAILIRRFGPPDVFEPAELPDPPSPAPGQVLLRVAASSVNPIDVKIRSGQVPALAPDFPAVLHADVSGIVEAVGPGVTLFKPGDRVYGCAGGFKGLPFGALAQFVLTDAHLLAPVPSNLSLEEAAALPIVAATAWQALVQRAQLRPAQHILVHAGAGGVGHIAVQLAAAMGAIVSTTVSSDTKARIASQLGAHHIINYRRESVSDYVARLTAGRGFDIVLDTVGSDNLQASFQAVRPGGTVVTIAARSTQDLSPLHAKGLTLHVVFLLLTILDPTQRPHFQQILLSLNRLIETHRLRVLLDPYSFSFDQVAAAHQHLESGRAVGKISLRCTW